jgi:glycosyltransferase involved in cell wall biosynthesis
VKAEQLVSIGLPIRNEERYLAETLDGLLAQDYETFEIIISDNASSDSTREICLAYAARDGRISYHRQATDRGARFNFNETFLLSSGQYFTWASGHDRRAPSAIRECVEVLERRRDIVLVYPRTRIQQYGGGLVDVDDDHLDTAGLATRRRLEATIREIDRCNAIHGVIRSEALRRTRLFGRSLGSDNVLLAELSVLGAFRQLEAPLFIRTENRREEAEIAVVARHAQILGIQGGFAKRRPYTAMGVEHVRGVWHVGETLPAKFLLAVTAVRAVLIKMHLTLLKEWFPRALRAGGGVKRIVRRR